MPTIFPASDFTQGSERWFSLRAGIPTASEFSRFLAPDFTLKEPRSKAAKEAGELNEGIWTYVCEKLAERFSGPLPAFTSFVTEQGKLNESLARKWLAMECETDIQEVAFIKSDDGKCGCSPDGLIGDDEGCEIKCPQTPNQVRYVLEGKLPEEYVHQVYGSLFVSGRKRWHFLSYFDGYPALHLVIERDESIMQRIGEGVRQFNALLDAAFEKLKKIP